jgi:hypothetical protein
VHYTDKEDLLVGKLGVFASNIGHQADMLIHEETNHATIFSARGWFYHIQAQSEILKIIAKDSATDLAMKNLYNILRNDIQIKVEKHFANTNSIPTSLIIDYMASSLMSLVTWWVKQDTPYSPERMDEMYQRLVMAGVVSMLEFR